jgi:hypothetical protein
MLDHSTASPSTLRRGLHALACLNVLVFGGSQASALPRVQVDPTPGLLLIQGGPPSGEQRAHEDRPAPPAGLHEVLRATRIKLEELTEATALVAADTKRHKEMQALEKDNERLAAELQQARARQTDLEGSRELAEGRIAELTKTIDAARRESTRLDEALATLRGQNEQLDGRLTRADAARLAALGEVRQTQAEMAKKLKTAADEVKQAKAELVSRHEELEINRQKLAEANGAREQIEARVIAMEKRIKRSGAEAERLRTELAGAKEQLKQAAAAAVAAERARQAASHEADRLLSGAEEAHKELIAAGTETARLQIVNAELERQMHSLHMALTSATATARQNLIVMQEKIEALNAALDLAQPEEAEPTQSPQAKPDAVEEEPDATLPQAPSAMAQPPAPGSARSTKPSSVSPTAAKLEGAPLKTANGELEKLIDSLVADSTPATTGTARHNPIMTEELIEEVNAALDVSRPEEVAPTSGPKAKSEAVQEKRDAAASQVPSAIAQSPRPGSVSKIPGDRLAGSATKLAMAVPTGSPLVDPGLTRFQTDLQALNDLELNAAGNDLFSGVESAGGREVSVSATAAWDRLPPVGRESYLESLLDYWVAARGGKGPAAVRIVDSRGQVLVEKSWP